MVVLLDDLSHIDPGIRFNIGGIDGGIKIVGFDAVAQGFDFGD